MAYYVVRDSRGVRLALLDMKHNVVEKVKRRRVAQIRIPRLPVLLFAFWGGCGK
jgi:hypothetical protein